MTTKHGFKTIGFERHSDSGAIGTASYGWTRIWRTSHDDKRYNDMQEEAIEIWREIEKRSGKEILVKTGLLWLLDPQSETYRFVSTETPKAGGGEPISMPEVKKRWPGLSGIPDHFTGYLAHNAGIVRANVGLHACKQLALEQGADLRYNSQVKSVDVKAGTVTLACGKVYRGKHVVISCGAFSD